MKNKRQLSEKEISEDSKALFADGFDDAIIGVAYQCGKDPIISYDIEKCINILVKRDGMTRDEAVEYFEFNTLGAYVGEDGPIYVRVV